MVTMIRRRTITHGVVRVAFLLASLVLSTVNAATYPIDWSQVAAVATSTVTRAASIVANTNIGTCICDLTWFQCDFNCACDTDCTQLELARFSATLPTGQYSDNNTVCFDPDFLKVNARGGVSTFFLDGALCVNKQSSSLTGSYFALPPTTVTDATFVAYRNAITSTYQTSITSSSACIIRNSDGVCVYQVGAKIGAIRASTSGIGSSMTSPYSYNRLGLAVPQPGPGGICNNNGYAQYLLAVNNTCTRVITNLATECGLGSASVLAANAYIYNLKIAANPVVDIASTTFWDIEFADVQSLDPTTLLYTTINVTRTIGSFPVPTWDATTCTCSNVLLELEYHPLMTSYSGILSGAQVRVLIGSVTSPAATSGTCATASPARLTQSYAVTWNQTIDAREVPHAKSGNPGYVVGDPLLVGSHVSIGTATYENAIAQEINGLRLLPQSSTGECIPFGTQPGLLDSFGQQAQFQTNMVTTCSLTMNLAQLATACQSGILSSYLNITSQKDYWFGVFGDSDFRKFAADWKEFTTVTPTQTLVTSAANAWNLEQRSCMSVFNSINLELLYVPVGSKFNPQNLILAGRITFGEGTWSFRHDDITATQSFPVTATVTWLPYYNTTYTSSSKPHLPSFPRDFFYVFYNQLNSAPSSMHPTIGTATISLLGLAMAYITALLV